MDTLWEEVRSGEKRYLKICAPMVRYSKLPFRMLVRLYDVDVCFMAALAAKIGFPWIYEYLTGNNCESDTKEATNS